MPSPGFTRVPLRPKPSREGCPLLRRYHIVSIPLRIVLNYFGDHDPNGMLYVLKEDERRVQEQVAAHPFTPVEAVQPLTIRAAVGDEVEILYENQLPFPAAMHIHGADYTVQTPEGEVVVPGEAPIAPVPTGGTLLYRWKALAEGIYLFSDVGNVLSDERGSNVHGLFGALIVERKGSWWTHPETGEPLVSGVFADVHHPLLPSFREFAWYFHDELEVRDLTGEPPIDPMTLQPSSTHAVNYRSEPMRNRMLLSMHGIVGPQFSGEEVHHDSWTYGDPATPILRAYVGDPIKIRAIHAGVQETHVFHYHVHQWRREADNPDSDLIDAQSMSPQSTYTVEPLYGAGSLQGAIGDAIIHCHLYPHFMDGMWGLQRTFDTLQDGSQCYPNGEPIAPLRPLPDRQPPPRPTPDKPGFPNFIPGVFGCKAPRPPLAIEGGREPTQLERNHFAPHARPGAVFVNPCIPGKTPEREYHLVAIQMPLVYNRHGWHDPEGRLFVLAADEEDVRAGRKPPEPLVIRANAGECVRVRFTNKLPEVIGGTAFQLVTLTREAGIHPHFVKFDPLVADGSNVGWNYDSSVPPGQTIQYQWFADSELQSAFFHDHLFANAHQNHGLFGCLTVEPKGAQYLDPRAGEPVRSGTQAMVVHPLIPDFREFTLFVHDFAFLFDANGCPVNPAPFPGSEDDPGVMGINYRNEPLPFRVAGEVRHDPAYAFSSHVHGDPVTPLLETYNGDPVRIRLLQGAHEESHSFNLHRQRWRKENANPNSRLLQQQHIGISEHFTLQLAVEGEGDFDLLYHFGSIDDIWLGNWGLMRSYGQRMPHLLPLPDRPEPPERAASDVPAPASRPSAEGQPAKCPPASRAPASRPPGARQPGHPGPPDAPVRRYEVAAIHAPVAYNRSGEQDPHGIVFALTRDVASILGGSRIPEPLVLRANVGEMVEVVLHNWLTGGAHGIPHHGYPAVPVEVPFPPSVRISLHPQLLVYDVRGSDGAAVGFNPDQTVGPGETITYRWYVDTEVGPCNLWDMADLRHHRHHGAFGIFIAEPKGSTYLDPVTRQPVDTGTQVVISNPLLGEFREFVLVMHDGARLVDSSGTPVVDPRPAIPSDEQEAEELADFEDQGSRGFNYRSERLTHRWKRNSNLANAFSSRIHGDPATPVFLAYPGDRVRICLTFPADRARAHSFTLHGHTWRRCPWDVASTRVAVVGESSVGSAADLYLEYGAGSLERRPGDYLYRSGNVRWDIELGAWGILRVLPSADPRLAPLRNRT